MCVVSLSLCEVKRHKICGTLIAAQQEAAHGTLGVLHVKCIRPPNDQIIYLLYLFTPLTTMSEQLPASCLIC